MITTSEIQEPFSPSFQAKSIHSGSISFGRFEKEGLSWERRSSFSHNKYLEEVDKCSKPGSVTEMKAHFEAHFKKKGVRVPVSLESQTWGVRQTGELDDATESFEDYRSDESLSENTSQSDSPCNYEQEKCGQGKSQCEYNEGSDHCASYDEIVVNSDDVIELDEEGGVDHGTLVFPLDNDEVSVDVRLPEMSIEIEVRDDDELKEDCSTFEETESRSDQHVPTKSTDVMKRPSSSSASRSKPLENIPEPMSVTKASTKRHGVTPKADSIRTKSSLTCNSNTNADTKTKSQKELRPKKIVESKPPTLKKPETKTPLATNRCKNGTYSSKLEMSTSASGFRFKCSERAEKRKEFYMKLEEKIHAKKEETNQVQTKTQLKAEAEMKEFRKSLNFKATPMPSFYKSGTRPGSHEKTEPSKVAQSRPRHTTSASSTNRAVTRVGYKHGFQEGKTVKVTVGNRKQSAVRDSDMQKGNVTKVKTKQNFGTRNSN
ncbi:unnamed protein product [Arabis nemorensis]|uniref:TPX2 C-terminal domain-containing protein n=1 Tax=Arabis nemorensis TaxID=586526 RepID=A0A565B1A3_9BRAS|nr:unnamed protein product [Arabis nemorensis]